MYETYKEKCDFKVVYVREAHPEDGWQVGANKRDDVIINTAKTSEDRKEAATACALDLKISIPIVLDDMKDTVEKAYAGWPDRIYIVGTDGLVAYKGGPGPRGFKPAEAEDALKKILAGN